MMAADVLERARGRPKSDPSFWEERLSSPTSRPSKTCLGSRASEGMRTTRISDTSSSVSVLGDFSVAVAGCSFPAVSCPAAKCSARRRRGTRTDAESAATPKTPLGTGSPIPPASSGAGPMAPAASGGSFSPGVDPRDWTSISTICSGCEGWWSALSRFSSSQPCTFSTPVGAHCSRIERGGRKKIAPFSISITALTIAFSL
mmetsp:Transcript_32719/g.77471  ORF Transcript_32719/g.77471 Transcript_32719/m.77471 type:complete len:202 (-) Transcript_32719:169-774(-)